MLFQRKKREEHPDFLSLLQNLVEQGFIKKHDTPLFCTIHTITPIIIRCWERAEEVTVERLVKLYSNVAGMEEEKTKLFVNKWLGILQSAKLIIVENGIIRDNGLKLIYNSMEAVMIRIHEILLYRTQ